MTRTTKTVIGVLFAVLAIAGLDRLMRADVQQVPSNSWVATGEMASARAGAAAVLLYDGHVLVTGGLGSDGAPTATVERYAPDGGAFLLETPPMATARTNHSATLLPDGRVLVAGGVSASGEAIASAETYDPNTNSWTTVAPLSVARSGHTATSLYDGRVVIAGGDAIGSIEVYDPNTQTFAASAASLGARTGHAATLLYDGTVFIAGGFDGTNPLASTVIYDPWEDTSTAGPALTTARAGHSATTLLDGKVLIAGGAGATSELASGEIYDPKTTPPSFKPAANSMIAARQHHQAILLPHSSQVLIVGGTAGLNGDAVATAELYVAWQGDGGSFYETTVPTDVDGDGNRTPRTPGTARAWSAVGALSFVPGLTIRSGPNDGLVLLTGGSAKTDAASPFKSSELYGFATVTTDKADYAPGQTVTIRGSGWIPDQPVTLTLVEDPPRDVHTLQPVTADATGNFTSTEFVPDQADLGIRFYLTATDAQSQAQTSFTDNFNATLQGQDKGSTIWQSGNLAGWQELDLVNTRVLLQGGPVTNQPIRIDFDHTQGTTKNGIQNLLNFTASSNVTFTIPVLTAPIGADVWSYAFNVNVADSADGFVEFRARLSAGAHLFTGSSLALNGSPSLGNLQIAKPLPGAGTPDLTIVKTGQANTAPGSTLIYTLAYSNKASALSQANGVQITDTLPAQLTFVSCTGGCTAVGNAVTWDLGNLAVGATGSVTIQATVNAGTANNTPVTNTAQIQSSQNDATAGDNTSSFVTTVFVPAIAGSVLTDPNGDGVDGGDGSGLSGATVSLFIDTNTNNVFNPGTDLQVASTVTTLANGDWAFTSGLTPSKTYFVVRTNPSGYTSTQAVPGTGSASTGTKVTNDQIKVVLGALPTFSANNKFLAVASTGSITGTVYNDVNGNGTFDSGDTGISGVSVSRSGASSGSTTTDVNGLYSFSGIAAGTYNVTYTPPAGYANTGAGTSINGIVLVAGASSSDNNFFARRTTSTAIVLTTGTTPAAYGTSLTFTATVTSAAGNPNGVGTVDFKDGTTVICPAVALTGTTATCTISTLLVSGSPHSITAEYSGTTTAPGYSGSSSAPLSQTITQAGSHVVITWNSSTYDGSANSASAVVQDGSNAAIPGATATLVYYSGNAAVGSPLAGAPTDAGTYTVRASYDGTGTNYASSFADKTITIGPAPVTATAGSGSTTYDGATHSPSACAMTGTYTGNLTCTNTPASVGPNAGTTTITPSVLGTGQSNFDITPINGSYTINQKQATANATNGGGVYKGSAYTGSGSCSDGLTPAISYTPGPGAPINVGTTSFTVTCGDGNHNYLDGTAPGSIVITQAPVTATAGSGSTTYDGATHSPSACAVTGTYTGDLACTNTPASVGPNAGTTTIIPSVSGTGLSNFEITPINGSYTIDQKQATANATNGGGAYKGSAYTGSGSCSDGLTPAITYAPGPGAPVDVGTTSFTVTCGDGNHNYLDGTAPGSIVITQAPVTATAGNGSTTYDGAMHSPSACAVTGTYTGNLTCTNTPASVGPNAGTTTITPSVSGTGLSNFEITPINGSYTIDQKQATANATNGGGVYKGSAYTGSGSCSDGLTPAITYAPGPGAPVDVGTTSFTVTCGDGNHNYLDGTAPGSIVITQAPVTATAGNGSTTYDGFTHAPSACLVTGTYKGDLTCTNAPASAGPNAGTTTITPSVAGTGLSNFDIAPVNGSYTIGPASSTVTVTCTAGAPHTYTGAAQTPCTAEATGVGMSPVDVTASIIYGNNTNVGSATAGASWSGDVNHTGNTGNGGFTIARYEFSACDGSNNCTGGTAPNTDGIGGRLTITPSVAFKGSATATVNLSPASLGAVDVLTSPGADPNPPNDPLPPNFKVWIAPEADPTHPVVFGTGAAVKTAPDVNGISAWHTVITQTLDDSLVPGSYVAYVYGDDADTLSSGAVANDDGYVDGDTANLAFPTLTAPLTVKRATATVTATLASYTYDSTAHAATGSATGVGTDGLQSPAVTFTYVGTGTTVYPASATPPKNVGTYTVTASFAGNTNYASGDSTPTAYTIQEAGSTVTVLASDAPYDGNAHGGTASWTSTGLDAETGTLTVSYAGRAGTTYGPSATAPTAAGKYTGSATFAGDTNHTGNTGSKYYEITKKVVTVASANNSKNYGAGDPNPLTTADLSGFVSGDGITASFTRATGSTVAAYHITTTLNDPASKLGNYSVANTGATFTINPDPTLITLDAKASGTNFECLNQYTATLTDTITNQGLSGVVLKLTIGTQGPVTATTDVNGSATFTLTLNQTPGVVPEAVSLYAAWIDPNRIAPAGASRSTFTVNPDPNIGPALNASTLYTGSRFFWTTSVTSSTATLTLTATVRDFGVCNGDLTARGDITKAKVSFAISSNDGTSFSPVSSGQNLPVGLVDPNDHTVGTASIISQYNLGKNKSAQLWVKVTVGGEYIMTSDVYDVPVTIAVPGQLNTLLAGGGLRNDGISLASGSPQNMGNVFSANGFFGVGNGTTSGAMQLGSVDFGGQVIYSKSGTNPQGQLTLIIHSYNKPDGTQDGSLHSYFVKSNSIADLALVGAAGTPRTASFSSKTNVYELLGGSRSGLDGGGVMQFMFSEPGGQYKVSAPTAPGGLVTLTCPSTSPGCASVIVYKSTGGVWFSSAWGPVTAGAVPQTIEKLMVNGTSSIQ